jgi:hypothetical protein
VPFGAANKVLGIPAGPSDPVGTALTVAEKSTSNRAPATVVLTLNKLDLPYLSQLFENASVKVVRARSPFAEKLQAAGWAWTGYQVVRDTHACYNKPN